MVQLPAQPAHAKGLTGDAQVPGIDRQDGIQVERVIGTGRPGVAQYDDVGIHLLPHQGVHRIEMPSFRLAETGADDCIGDHRHSHEDRDKEEDLLDEPAHQN